MIVKLPVPKMFTRCVATDVQAMIGISAPRQETVQLACPAALMDRKHGISNFKAHWIPWKGALFMIVDVPTSCLSLGGSNRVSATHISNQVHVCQMQLVQLKSNNDPFSCPT